MYQMKFIKPFMLLTFNQNVTIYYNSVHYSESLISHVVDINKSSSVLVVNIKKWGDNTFKVAFLKEYKPNEISCINNCNNLKDIKLIENTIKINISNKWSYIYILDLNLNSGWLINTRKIRTIDDPIILLKYKKLVEYKITVT